MANELKVGMIESILALKARRWSNRRIARELELDRGTVAKYLALAGQSKPAKVLTGSDAPAVESKPAKVLTGSEAGGTAAAPAEPSVSAAVGPGISRSLCEPYREVIVSKLGQDLTAQRIFQDLHREHEFTGTYHSVRRYVARLGRGGALPFRRMECAAGEVAQVDFGTGAPIVTLDGKQRRPHVFRIVLSHSRKAYSEAVYRQTTENFIRCLENACHHFGGVPKVLVIDNLKAAVTQADWYDPDLNPKIRSFCAHYGTTILPTKPRTPRHKGKVESSVGYVKKNALKGRTFASLEEENQFLRDWETTVADTRIHGTTRQQVSKVFAEVERPALQSLPTGRFPFFHEGERSVHRDGHVEVAKAYYSVPPEYLGRVVWARWDGRLVRIFNERFEQIALHPQHEPGRFSTQDVHICSEKISGIERGVDWLLSKIQRIGAAATAWAQAVIDVRGLEGVRVLQGLLALTKKHRSAALDHACASAHGAASYRLKTVRKLLERPTVPAPAFEFLEQHPLIRGMAEYELWLPEALVRESQV